MAARIRLDEAFQQLAMVEDMNISEESDSEEGSELEDNIEMLYESESDITSSDEETMGNAESTFMSSKSGKQWSLDPPPMTRRIASNILRDKPGPTSKCNNITSISDAFNLFITDGIVQTIVEETNRKGHSVYSDTSKIWYDCDTVELRAFFGLLLLSGVYKQRRAVRDTFWSKDPTLNRPIFTATMSRDRFKELYRMIRFDNWGNRDMTNKLAPIEKITTEFVKCCKECFVPYEHVTIDEQLVGFRGRCPFRVYMKSKPNKYGIKVWAAADSKTFYTWNLQVYSGKRNNIAEKGQGKRVVLDMIQGLGKGHGITCDNFFTSIPLAEELLNRNNTMIGTVRKNNAAIPKEMQANRARVVHSSLFGFCDKITLVSYVPKKNKSVILLSTQHHEIDVDEENEGKPEIIAAYNATKGGVDTVDKLVAEYSCKRQTNRWPLCLFMNWMDIAAVNALVITMHILPELVNDRNDRRRVFLLTLAKELVMPHIVLRSERLPRNIKGITFQAMQIVLGNANTSLLMKKETFPLKRGRCRLCCRSEDRKVSTKCMTCGNFVCTRHNVTTTTMTCDTCVAAVNQSDED